MAFHPNYPTDPRVFFYYTGTSSGLVDRVSQFRLAAGGTTLEESMRSSYHGPAASQVIRTGRPLRQGLTEPSTTTGRERSQPR